MMKKILVVDDSELVYQELKYHLRGSGRYEAAYYCSDAGRLVQVYEELRPDLVTVDVVMPGVDGIEAARALLRQHPEARVVVITSMVYHEIMAQAEAAGVVGFLPKPFTQEQILRAFDFALRVPSGGCRIPLAT